MQLRFNLIYKSNFVMPWLLSKNKKQDDFIFYNLHQYPWYFCGYYYRQTQVKNLYLNKKKMYQKRKIILSCYKMIKSW